MSVKNYICNECKKPAYRVGYVNTINIMELWDLENCKNPDNAVKAGPAQGGNYRCKRMSYTSYAV